MQPLEKITLACSIIRQFNNLNPVHISFPFEYAILDMKDEQELLTIYNEIMSPFYEPENTFIIDAPKKKGLIRHLSYLSIKDQLLYTCLIIDCFPHIYKIIARNNVGDPINVLRQYPINSRWMKTYVRGDIMERRWPLFNKNYSSILQSDITAYGLSIDIRIICKELVAAGCSASTIDSLEKCLRKWSALGYKGIPQVYFSSDLLAEFYLKPIDNCFSSSEESIFLRESDNIEIWCCSQAYAKKMLIKLSKELYERGLYLNNFKTKILNKRSIDRDEHPMEGKKYGWRNHFKERFNGLMHLYYHLSNKFILNECYERLIKNPEFTIALLQHYSNEKININKSLLKFISSNNAIYPFQNYFIIKWLIINYNEEDQELYILIRELAWNDQEPYYLRSIARHFIFQHGTESDCAMINDQIFKSDNEFEKRDMAFLAGLTVKIA